MYMLEIDYTRHKTCFVLLNAPSSWASPGPPMPRPFLLSTPLFMTFHILYIHGFSPIPRKIHLCPSQLHRPSPVILSPVSLSPGWAWSLDSWKHEGEESPLLFTVWSPVVPDLFPGQEPPQLSGCYSSAAHRHNLCFATTPKGDRPTTSLLIWEGVSLPNKEWRGSYTGIASSL